MTSLFLEGTIPHKCFGEVYLLDFRVPRSCTQAQYCCCTTHEYLLELGLPWRDQRQCVRWHVIIVARNISFRECVSGRRICGANRVLCCFITRLIIEFLPVAAFLRFVVILRKPLMTNTHFIIFEWSHIEVFPDLKEFPAHVLQNFRCLRLWDFQKYHFPNDSLFFSC